MFLHSILWPVLITSRITVLGDEQRARAAVVYCNTNPSMSLVRPVQCIFGRIHWYLSELISGNTGYGEGTVPTVFDRIHWYLSELIS